MYYANYEGTRNELLAFLGSIPAILAGRAPDRRQIGHKIMTRLGISVLSLVQEDFITKSRGGMGTDGVSWQKLSPSTIVSRRTTQAQRQTLKVGGKRTRGFLTPSQDARWRDLYSQRKARLLAGGMPPHQAAKAAAKAAWAILKGEGATTRKMLLTSQDVDILRDTGELLRSLTPGVEDRPSREDGQIFVVQPGRIIVGTNKKPWHHYGIPGKLSARKLWPDLFPNSWWQVVTRSFNRGITKAIADALERRS